MLRSKLLTSSFLLWICLGNVDVLAYEPLIGTSFSDVNQDLFNANDFEISLEKQELAEHWGPWYPRIRRRPRWFPPYRYPICTPWNPCFPPPPPIFTPCSPYTPCFPPVVVLPPPIFFPFFINNNQQTAADWTENYCDYAHFKPNHERRARRLHRNGSLMGRDVRNRPWRGQHVLRTEDDRLLMAVCRTDIRAIRSYLRRGYNPDQLWEATGETALIIAAKLGNFRIVRLLVNAGANMCYIDGNDYTATDWAYENHHRRIAEFLESEEEFHCSSHSHFSHDDRYDGNDHRDRGFRYEDDLRPYTPPLDPLEPVPPLDPGVLRVNHRSHHQRQRRR